MPNDLSNEQAGTLSRSETIHAMADNITPSDLLAFLDGERCSIEIDRRGFHGWVGFRKGAFVLEAEYGRIEYEGKFSTLRGALLQLMEEAGAADDLLCDTPKERALAEADAWAGEYPE